MIQVKLRDFLRDFTKYKDQAVEVLGKNGESWLWQKNVRQSSDSLSDKKEIADKIVEEVLSKDSTDNAEVSDIPVTPKIQEGLNRIARTLDKIYPEEIVGTCDICHTPSKELWEHEEEGIERNVCFGCFMTVFKGQASNPKPYRTQLKEFLLTKKKVESVYNVGRAVEVPLKASAQFSDFNPIPKPPKKKKHESD